MTSRRLRPVALLLAAGLVAACAPGPAGYVAAAVGTPGATAPPVAVPTASPPVLPSPMPTASPSRYPGMDGGFVLVLPVDAG